ncbi:MAG: lamin tail domain-containing protein, partial [Phycisphaeraceae bacterium]|nr:lamin tail domain-containing protein [Phycisphaeraceae bacterium]
MTHDPQIFHRLACSRMLALCLGVYLLVQSQALSQVLINEFMASNSTIADAAGQYDDWIELHNPTDHPVDVGGMSLTDDLSQPDRWQFPLNRSDITTIAAHGYL